MTKKELGLRITRAIYKDRRNLEALSAINSSGTISANLECLT